MTSSTSSTPHDSFEQLVALKLATYLDAEQIGRIRTAFRLADTAHKGQLRTDGSPYIQHPLSVAEILADMRLDGPGIIAAILHDTLEDTTLEKKQIEATFDTEVAELVDGVSKLTLIQYTDRAQQQAENLRKMILAMTRDIRVILIKMADRLHNMRTLHAVPIEKQKRVAKETLEIYAPIANRLGIRTFQTEFEDLCFSYLYPVRFQSLKNVLKKAGGNRTKLIASLEKKIQSALEQGSADFISVAGREKHLYSLYRKMKTKHLSLHEIMDLYAVRIVVRTLDACYRALGLIHALYRPLHGRFKDYIAVPKTNGYQSLHTAVQTRFGVPVEIQIRTQAMDRIAENGIAAHWLYKNNPEEGRSEAERRTHKWVKAILDIQQHAGDPLEFIENIKTELYPGEVYVFTPKGDILCLPQGSSCVDFAYAVHTDVGNTCVATKIDRRLAPLNSRPQSGQTIEILTAPGAHPNPAWLNFVVTPKARNNIRHFLKNQSLLDAQQLGERLWKKALDQIQLDTGNLGETEWAAFLKEIRLEDKTHFMEQIGLGVLFAPLLTRKLQVFLHGNAPSPTEGWSIHQVPLSIQGTEGMVVHYAKCCHPVPGDDIVGTLAMGRGIMIHRTACSQLVQLEKNPEKQLPVHWSDHIVGDFIVPLKLRIHHLPSALAQVTTTVAELESNIDYLHVDEKDSRRVHLTLAVQVKNQQHLLKIVRRLQKLSVIEQVIRE